MLEVCSFLKQNIWERKQIDDDAQDHQDWSKNDCHEELYEVLTFVCFSLVGKQNEDTVGVNLEDQNWC